MSRIRFSLRSKLVQGCLGLLVALTLVTSSRAQAQNQSQNSEGGGEFMTSVIYGTLAGALVGAASLAFTSNPGDNLTSIARGASFGLYAGILLGLYVTYGVGDDDYQQQQGPAQTRPQTQFKLKNLEKGFAVYPVLPDFSSKDSHWGVGFRLLNFQF